MITYEIPIRNAPARMQVMLEGVVILALAFYWVSVGPFPDDDPGMEEGGWHMDIFATNGDPLVCGIPLVTGANLVEQYPDLDLPPMWVTTDGDPDAVPTFLNLGAGAHVYMLSN